MVEWTSQILWNEQTIAGGRFIKRTSFIPVSGNGVNGSTATARGGGWFVLLKLKSELTDRGYTN